MDVLLLYVIKSLNFKNVRIGLIQFEGRYPVKMMNIHYINDKILIHYPYYSGLYQDQAEIERYTKR